MQKVIASELLKKDHLSQLPCEWIKDGDERRKILATLQRWIITYLKLGFMVIKHLNI